MKKILLSCAMLFVATVSQAAIGDDLTAKYLKNADFSQGTPMTKGICTYDKDMDANGTEYFGQQEVPEWTAFSLSTNTYEAPGLGDNSPNRAASGIFSFNDEDSEDDDFLFLGGKGYKAPFLNSSDETAGQFLGLVAVWGGTAQYTQPVTLPAGAYTITYMVYNGSGTTAVSSNLFGFIADGKAYTCTENAWTEVGAWTEMSVSFLLTEETSGVVSVGYVGPGGSGAMPHLFVESVKIEEADPAPLQEELEQQMREQVDALKEKLLPLLEAGDDLSVNTKDGWAVYNNDNATLEEVQAAIEAQKEINEKGMTDLTDFFINNAHFAEGLPLDNGVCTYDYDMPKNETTYFGMQPIAKWIASSPSDNVQLMENDKSTPANPLNSRASGLFAVGSGENIWLGSKGDTAPATKANGSTEGNVFGFISVWGGKAYYSQHVTLPAGNYTITIPTYNERGTGAISKNMCGFIADSGDEYLAETKTFPVGQWNNETIKFTLDEETAGTINIGYVAANAGSGSMPHLFVDEFILKYNGLLDIKPSLLALQGAVRTAENYPDENEFFEAAIAKRLEAAAAKGQDLVDAGSTDDDVNTEMATEINNIIIEANASVAVYKKLNAFLENDLSKVVDKYTGSELDELASDLSEKYDGYYEKYEKGEYNAEQINEIIAGLKPAVRAAIKEALAAAATDGKDHSLDISPLFDNIDYANSTVEGWQNETGTGAFLSRVQTAEVWNQSNFNVYQTLAEMPAGAYEITANGFYRSAANLDNYAEFEAGEVVGSAYIYAGGNKVLMHNVAEYAAEQDENHTAAADAKGELYVPNSNDNAHYIFYEEGEAVNKVTTALIEDGDLTIGVKGENLEGNAWAVWGAFIVVYKGVNEEVAKAALNAQIEDLIAQAVDVREDDFVQGVTEAVNKLGNAEDAGKAAIKGESIEDKTAAIQGLKDAMAYAAQCEPMKLKLNDVFLLYYGLNENSKISSTDKTVANILGEINDPEDDVPSIEQMQEWIDALPGAWMKYVMGQSEMASASENAPVDVTEAILNPGFEGALGDATGAQYWSSTKNGGNEGYQEGIYEYYNNNSFDINQTMNGLTPGYYRVKVQAFYRAGDNNVNLTSYVETPDSINTAELYANDRAVNLKNVLDLENVEESSYEAGTAFGVEGEVTVSYKDNEAFAIPNNRASLALYFEAGCYWNELDAIVGEDGVLKLGIRKETGVGNDWCPYDNFQLYYLGTTAPTAIEAVAANAQAQKTAIYDLQGRKVSKAQKGMYIMNGKVVVVK